MNEPIEKRIANSPREHFLSSGQIDFAVRDSVCKIDLKSLIQEGDKRARMENPVGIIRLERRRNLEGELENPSKDELKKRLEYIADALNQKGFWCYDHQFLKQEDAAICEITVPAQRDNDRVFQQIDAVVRDINKNGFRQNTNEWNR